MIDLKAEEETIVNALKDAITYLHIEAYPDQPLTYNLKHHKGAVLVRFDGAEGDEPVEWSNEYQVRRYRWAIVVAIKDRSGHEGVYETLVKVDETLTSLKIRDHHLRYLRTEYLTYDTRDGAWIYRTYYEIIN